MHPRLSFDQVLAPAGKAPVDPPPLSSRLELCSRLLAVAAEELDALARGDHLKRYQLADQREELVREIRPADDGPDHRPATTDELMLLLPQEVARALAEALYELEEREEEVRRMQDRWTSLEEDALKVIHGSGRIASVRAGHYPDRPRSDARLDLRF